MTAPTMPAEQPESVVVRQPTEDEIRAVDVAIHENWPNSRAMALGVLAVARAAAPRQPQGAEVVEGLREALIQADLKIRSFPGADQSDVQFIRDALNTSPQPVQPAPVGRDALISMIMDETNDDIVEDGWKHLGKPNVLVQGCRFLRRRERASATEGYENPEAAAKQFAGFIADRILASLSQPAPEAGEATGAQAIIRDGQIVISIDVDALPLILSGSIATNSVSGTFKVTDPAIFAKEVCHSLNDEKEDGTTRVHMMFDSAFNHAIDQGAEGVEEITEDEFEVEAARLQAALSPVAGGGEK